MNSNDSADSEIHYNWLPDDIVSQIKQSHYRAARLANRELLLLYFAVGKGLSEKVASQKWGAKALEQLAATYRSNCRAFTVFHSRT